MSQWMRSDIEEKDETVYFFHRTMGGGAIANVSLSDDGTLEFVGHNQTIVITNIGTKEEKVTIKNAADMVV